MMDEEDRTTEADVADELVTQMGVFTAEGGNLIAGGTHVDEITRATDSDVLIVLSDGAKFLLQVREVG